MAPDIPTEEAVRLRRRHVSAVLALATARDQALYLKQLPEFLQAEILAELEPALGDAIKAELRRLSG